jgi:hypothetical protein
MVAFLVLYQLHLDFAVVIIHNEAKNGLVFACSCWSLSCLVPRSQLARFLVLGMLLLFQLQISMFKDTRSHLIFHSIYSEDVM